MEADEDAPPPRYAQNGACLAETLEARGADEEAEALAAERIRSGAAERTQDGAQALAELGIPTS